MWISRKNYNFLKENAEKNIDKECEIFAAQENVRRGVARAMEEYSAVLKERDELLKERDELKLRVIELEHRLESIKNTKEENKTGYWEQGDMYDMGDVCSLCGYDSCLEPCYLPECPSCHAKMETT